MATEEAGVNAHVVGWLSSFWHSIVNHPDQAVILVLGAAAIWLVGRKEAWRKWGYVAGLMSQPFWLYTTWTNGQYGMFILSVWYVYAWAQGWYNNRHAKDLTA